MWLVSTGWRLRSQRKEIEASSLKVGAGKSRVYFYYSLLIREVLGVHRFKGREINSTSQWKKDTDVQEGRKCRCHLCRLCIMSRWLGHLLAFLRNTVKVFIHSLISSFLESFRCVLSAGLAIVDVTVKKTKSLILWNL